MSGAPMAEQDERLSEDEKDPATLWAEIWRLRTAVKGPAGFATWQDAATEERIRRIRAERAAISTPAQPAPLRCDGCGKTMAEHDRLAQCPAANDQRDAARWRKYRALHWSESSLCAIASVNGNAKLLGMDCPFGERLDAAIDAIESDLTAQAIGEGA